MSPVRVDPPIPEAGVSLFLTPVPAGRDVRTEARRLALRASAFLLARPEAEIRLEREPGGRPFLAGAAGTGSGLHLSVSHARGLAAVALTRLAPVGLDLELVRPLPTPGPARRWFTEPEAVWLAEQPTERAPAAFLWLWTRKEAAGKAFGTGLRGGGKRRPVGLPTRWRTAGDDRVASEPGAPGLCFAMPGVAAQAAGRAEFVLAVAVADGAASGATVVLHRHGPENGER